MQYLLLNELNEIEGVFDREITHPTKKIIKLKNYKNPNKLIGKKVGTMQPSEMKIAIICNWRTPCGISTYSQYLVNALKPKVKELKIYSEIEDKANTSHDIEENVIRCWKRGESMLSTLKKIKEWKPNFVIIQHEFGIFSKATYFLQLLQGLEDIPHAVVLHSVYGNHFDKTICTSAIKNIICHSNEAKNALFNIGHETNLIQVIPHGCVVYDDVQELWNIFQTPYAIVQFGFGFFYKGVDRAIEAIGHLKASNPEKYKDIFYCYLCSESANAVGTHAQYHRYLNELIEKLDLKDNVVILRKYNSESIIKNYLRTAKLALFPYVTDPKNLVFGASGAIRIAMGCNSPVIASESHMYDDLESIVPRPSSPLELATEIDKVFSDESYRKKLIEKNQLYIRENDWNVTADRYIKAIKIIMEKEKYIEINE
jgi:glycosyltransferase involved in cell wall biosynthesis